MLSPAGPESSYEHDLAVIERLAATPANSAYELEKAFGMIYNRAATANLDAYDVREVAKDAVSIQYRLFDVRMRLRDRLGEFEAKGMMSLPVQKALRDAFRILRYVNDMVGEVALAHGKHIATGEGLRGFTGGETNTLVNWRFYAPRQGRDITFRSGDVLLVRGERHNSAAIARIGDVDSQFSHVCIVYLDGGGTHFVVESLIEDGAVFGSLAHALDHGIARAVLYRHKDADLAERAAKLIYEHVKASREGIGRRILYDFSMRLDTRKRLFCSKLVRLAYEMASDGTVELPRYPTRIGMQNRDFLRRIGVKATETFAPGDIDMEKEFDLVCEWQDYTKTGSVRLQDFTCDKIFEWMDAYDFRFKETFLIWIVSVFGRLSAYFSDSAKEILSSIAPKVPINMPRSSVAAVAMLHRTAEPIYREVLAANDACMVKHFRPLHGNEVFELLEDIRRRHGRQIGYLSAD
ncbi:MAG: YiiX/YebB-like N1pC/P60 family cysteine hydrolase [Hyphomicrobiaceae bacterium]